MTKAVYCAKAVYWQMLKRPSKGACSGIKSGAHKIMIFWMNLGEFSSTLINVLSTVLNVLNILSTVKNVFSMVCLRFVYGLSALVFLTLCCSELTELSGHVALWDKKCPLWDKERPFRERHLKNVRGRTGYIEVQLLLIPTTITISIATPLLLLLLLLQLSSPLVWFFGRRGYLEAKSFQDWNKGIFIRSLIVSVHNFWIRLSFCAIL